MRYKKEITFEEARKIIGGQKGANWSKFAAFLMGKKVLPSSRVLNEKTSRFRSYYETKRILKLRDELKVKGN